jgi:hypothetical protein
VGEQAASTPGHRASVRLGAIARLGSGWSSLPLGERLFVGSVAALAAYFALRGPVLSGDAGSYLQHTNFRPPAYPLYLDLLHLVFRGAWLHAAVAGQLLLGGWASLVLGRRIGRLFSVAGWPVLLAQVALFSSLAKLGVTITADGLSYAAFLLFAGAIADCLEGPTPRTLMRATALAALLILLRSQFLFILPGGLLALAVVAVARWRLAAPIAGCVLGLLLAIQLIPRTYNWAYQGVFRTTSATGLQLLTVVLYVAEPRDREALPTPEDRQYFDAVLARLRAGGMLATDRAPGIPTWHHLNRHYNEICFDGIVREYARERLGVSLDATVSGATTAIPPKEWSQMDATLTRISFRLLRRSWPRYLAHVGGSVYEIYKTYLLILGALLATGLIEWRRSGAPARFLVALVLLWGSNLLLVAMVEVPMGRYTFYVDAVVAATVALLVAAKLATRVAPAPPVRPAASP